MYDSETVLLDDGSARLGDVAARRPIRAQVEDSNSDWDAIGVRALDIIVSILALIFLRRSSIDELPQLMNVLRGEMSIVGPRPIVEDEIVRYGRKFKMYCRVRPGITGLWQVSGRNDISYRRRVACDVIYARSKSLKFDLRIILMTLPAVLHAKGSY